MTLHETSSGRVQAPSPTPPIRPASVPPLHETAGATPEAPLFCVRLFAEEVVVEQDGYGEDFKTVEAPLIRLDFQYGGQRIRASDPRDSFFRAERGGMAIVARHKEAESRARYLLESFGCVDLGCTSNVALAPNVEADYLVRCDGDAHDYTAFGAYVVPQLRSLGFRIEIDPGYPFRILESDPPWYAVLSPEEGRPDWFGLELGIEVEGRRVNLLPALVDLLHEGSVADGLSFASRSRRAMAVPVGVNLYLPVPSEQLKSIMRIVAELYRGDLPQGQLRFSDLQSESIQRLDEVFAETGSELTWEGEHEVQRRARQHVVAPKKTQVPPELKATLRSYQQEGLDWLQGLRARGVGGVLADDMGLGKTLQTISHLSVEKAEGRMTAPSLIVAPTSLVGNWQREIGKFAPHLRVLAYHGPRRHETWDQVATADVVITSYPILIRDEERFTSLEFYLLILDEAQTIKNIRGQAYRAAKAVSAEHRLCLSGTPVENHLGELFSLVDFLNPGLLGDELHFNRWYRVPIERLGDEERMASLRQQLTPFILRRLKSDVAKDLPPKTELMRPVELTGKQRELYESIRMASHAEVRKLIQKKGLAASTVPLLGALMKLRQVCCDPRLLRMEAARFVRESAKYEVLFELVEKQLAHGHRILIFSQFTTMLSLISDGLRQRKVSHVALTGATADRQKMVDTFESGRADVFLISLKAGGTGLTLTSADTVIHFDPWWNPAAQAQATDRAYRIGQKRPVFVFNLFAAGSVEERILQLQRHKRKLADALLGVPGEGNLSLTEEDVDNLFAPLG